MSNDIETVLQMQNSLKIFDQLFSSRFRYRNDIFCEFFFNRIAILIRFAHILTIRFTGFSRYFWFSFFFDFSSPRLPLKYLLHKRTYSGHINLIPLQSLEVCVAR